MDLFADICYHVDSYGFSLLGSMLITTVAI